MNTGVVFPLSSKATNVLAKGPWLPATIIASGFLESKFLTVESIVASSNDKTIKLFSLPCNLASSMIPAAIDLPASSLVYITPILAFSANTSSLFSPKNASLITRA